MLRSVGEWFVVDIPGQHIVLILKDKAVYKNSWTALSACPLKVGPIHCPETFVTDYKPTLKNIPEDQTSSTPQQNSKISTSINVLSQNIEIYRM